MRTKALILSAMIGVAGIVSSFAQNVYSVNVVGYINQTLNTTWSLIANQLDNGQGNYVTNLFPPVTTFTVFKFNGLGYDTLEYRGAPFNRWDPPAQAAIMTLAPGEGAFVKNKAANPATSPINLTFVGEVLQGKLTNELIAGFEVYSAMVPQDGLIGAVHKYVPTAGDVVYKYDPATSTYDPRTYRGAPFNSWNPSEPSLAVGEAVFIKPTVAKLWIREFTVE